MSLPSLQDLGHIRDSGVRQPTSCTGRAALLIWFARKVLRRCQMTREFAGGAANVNMIALGQNPSTTSTTQASLLKHEAARGHSSPGVLIVFTVV